MLEQEIEQKLEAVESLARLMDSQFTLPKTSIKLGLDTIIGLIPGIGDTISLGIASSIVVQAYRMGVRKAVLVKMTINLLLDWLIGLIPLIGDIFDLGWKGNIRNAQLLRAELERLSNM